MKRRVALLMGMILLFAGVLAGCGGRTVTTEDKDTQKQEETNQNGNSDNLGENNQNHGSDDSDKNMNQNNTENNQNEKYEDLRLGMVMIPSINSSKDAGDEEGLVQTDVDIATVLVDGDGKVVSCLIDSAQVKVNFDDDGKITTDLDSQFQTKNELGDSYGMKKASSIGKEWYEQAAAFAAYCVGKTKDEITNMAVTDGKAADTDLAASCTLYVGGFQAIVTKAIDNAVEGGASVALYATDSNTVITNAAANVK